jgi:6-phosphogluconolactonase (cycloisomerase 2 family)
VGAGGTLTPMTDPASGLPVYVATGVRPSAVATAVVPVNINGANFSAPFVYVANQGSNTISVYQGNPSTGVLAAVGTPVATGNGPTAMVALNDVLYVSNGVDNTISVYSISSSPTANPGTLTPIGQPVSTGTNPVAISYATVNLTTYLYVVNRQSNDVYAYAINFTTQGPAPYGSLTLIAKYAAGTAPTSVAIPYSLAGG